MPGDQSPATKQDLGKAIDALEQRLTETMRDMQTEVLRAFHNWARPVEIKTRSLGAAIAGLEERISLLEERLNASDRGPKHQ
jgi:hypothetical protein